MGHALSWLSQLGRKEAYEYKNKYTICNLLTLFQFSILNNGNNVVHLQTVIWKHIGDIVFVSAITRKENKLYCLVHSSCQKIIKYVYDFKQDKVS
jgi:hypothetical protein